jgi:FMN reductase
VTAVRVVLISGGTSVPSRTLALGRRILAAVAGLRKVESEVIDLAQIGSDLGRALTRAAVSETVERALRSVETAELLIAVTPVYRGSYTGHFKHLFDLIHQDALIDVPVILGATGGSEKHCLVIEHQLRPLFGFLQAYAVPIGVYAAPADFENREVHSEFVLARIETAARQAAGLVRSRPRNTGQLSAATSTRAPDQQLSPL